MQETLTLVFLVVVQPGVMYCTSLPVTLVSMVLCIYCSENQFVTLYVPQDNGPPPKSELTLKNQFLTEEPLTPVTYKERFHILLHWEEHAHMEAMRK